MIPKSGYRFSEKIMLHALALRTTALPFFEGAAKANQGRQFRPRFSGAPTKFVEEGRISSAQPDRPHPTRNRRICWWSAIFREQRGLRSAESGSEVAMEM